MLAETARRFDMLARSDHQYEHTELASILADLCQSSAPRYLNDAIKLLQMLILV